MSKLATRGSGNATAKLNETTVRLVRIAHKLGVPQIIMAHDCGVSKTQMWRIVHNVDWKHVSKN